MTRIAVLGQGPLPGEPGRRHLAMGKRADQFARALAAAGCDVRLLLLDDEPGGDEPADALPGVKTTRLLRTDAERPDRLRATLAALAPDAVVGAATYPSYLAARSGCAPPLWIDVHGDPTAEGQARAASRGDDEPTFDALWLLAWCLRRGDRFSAVSGAQRLALLGQLGLAGRLNRATAATEMVAVLRDACEPEPVGDTVLGPFRILFGGSFNSWIDGETLIGALRIALERDPTIEFVATGGEVPGFLEAPWREFVASLERFPDELRRRIEIHGWIPLDELVRVEATVACGVVPERKIVERELGSQTRALRMLARATPLVTTALTELGRELRAAGVAAIYEPGDAESLAGALLRLARDREAARRLGSSGRRWLAESRSIAATCGPLVAWASAPSHAPDRVDGTAKRVAARLAGMLSDQLHLETIEVSDAEPTRGGE